MERYSKDIDAVNKNYVTYYRHGKGINFVFTVRYNENNQIEYLQRMNKMTNFSNDWYVRPDAGNITKQEFETELERAIEFLKQ